MIFVLELDAFTGQKWLCVLFLLKLTSLSFPPGFILLAYV